MPNDSSARHSPGSETLEVEAFRAREDDTCEITSEAAWSNTAIHGSVDGADSTSNAARRPLSSTQQPYSLERWLQQPASEEPWNGLKTAEK